MPVAIRPTIEGIAPYRPGRRPDRGAAVRQIKASSNELPWEPPRPLLDALVSALVEMNRYPDYHKLAAREAIANHLAVDIQNVALDNGSGSLIQNLARLVCETDTEAIMGWPSFDAYPISVLVTGARERRVPLGASGAMDLGAMAAAVTEHTRLIYVCNPNNPTGGLVGFEELRAFLAAVPRHVLVVLDEAYREFVDREPVDATLVLLNEFPNLVIVRTLSKAFGLAGVRAGYALASEELVNAVNKTMVGFSVNSVAQAAVVAAHSSEMLAVVDERVAKLREERNAIEAALGEAGVTFIPSQANFIMILGDTAELSDRLEGSGVIARPFPAVGGVRITVSTPQDNAVMINALTASTVRA